MLRNIHLANILVIVACLKMTFASSISSAKRLDLALCRPRPTSVVAVKDYVYVACDDPFNFQIDSNFPTMQIRIYDSSHPHDLLMVMNIEKAFFNKILGFDNSNSLYAYDNWRQCVWKIDILKHTVKRWLEGVRYDDSLTVSNDNSVMAMRKVDDKRFLEIYYEDARPVRRVSLPPDFKRPYKALQKPDGEFVVSHHLKEKVGFWISILSIDGKILTHLRLREAVGFTDFHIFSVAFNDKRLVFEPFSGNLYSIDLATGQRKLTDLTVTIDNSSEGMEVIFRDTDGEIFLRPHHLDISKVFLTFRTDDRDLLVNVDIDMNIFPVNIRSHIKVKAFRGGAYVLNWESRNWSHTDAKAITVHSSRNEDALRSTLVSTHFDIFSNLFKNEDEKTLLLFDKNDLDGSNNIKAKEYPFGIGCARGLRMLKFYSYRPRYLLDWEIGNWKPMEFTIFIVDSPEEKTDQILHCLSTDPGILSLLAVDATPQKIRLFFDADDNNLIIWEDIAGDTYLLDMKTQNGSKIGSIPTPVDTFLSYDSGGNRFTLMGEDTDHTCNFVNIFHLNKT